MTDFDFDLKLYTGTWYEVMRHGTPKQWYENYNVLKLNTIENEVDEMYVFYERTINLPFGLTTQSTAKMLKGYTTRTYDDDDELVLVKFKTQLFILGIGLPKTDHWVHYIHVDPSTGEYMWAIVSDGPPKQGCVRLLSRSKEDQKSHSHREYKQLDGNDKDDDDETTIMKAFESITIS